MILGGRSCPTPSCAASTSRNPSAAALSELVHDRLDRERRGTLMVLALRLFWRLACGDRAAPGSFPLIPPDDRTHALRIADATPSITQTDGRHRARAVPHPYSTGTVHPRCGRWTVRRRLLNPVSSLASVGKKDRQEGEGACVPVCREAITSFSRSRPPRVAAPRARERAAHGPDRCACGVLETLHSGNSAWDNLEELT